MKEHFDFIVNWLRSKLKSMMGMQAPKSLLSLGAMLDEYICLKEQKVFLDQEKCRLEHEKFRVQNLLRGMQDVMNLYNVGEIVNPPPTALSSMPKTAAVVPQIDQAIVSSAGAISSLFFFALLF